MLAGDLSCFSFHLAVKLTNSGDCGGSPMAVPTHPCMKGSTAAPGEAEYRKRIHSLLPMHA